MMQEEDEPKPKAWLEIQGSAMSNPHQLNTVSVGEHTTILVKTWLPENISGQVVDCLAHDGLGETSQALVDPAGCPVDEVLVPRLHKSQELSRRQNGYQFTVQATSFPAFKFPDRESVHIRCGLQLCRQYCQKVDCTSDLRFQHRHQRRLKGEEGEVLDYIQLFNSVEVLAPGIEMENMHQNSHFQSSGMCLHPPPRSNPQVCVYILHHVPILRYVFTSSTTFQSPGMCLHPPPCSNPQVCVYILHHVPILRYVFTSSTTFQSSGMCLHPPPCSNPQVCVYILHHVQSSGMCLHPPPRSNPRYVFTSSTMFQSSGMCLHPPPRSNPQVCLHPPPCSNPQVCVYILHHVPILRRLEAEVHKAKYGNRLSRSTPHHFSSVFAYGASRSHRSCYKFSTICVYILHHVPILRYVFTSSIMFQSSGICLHPPLCSNPQVWVYILHHVPILRYLFTSSTMFQSSGMCLHHPPPSSNPQVCVYILHQVPILRYVFTSSTMFQSSGMCLHPPPRSNPQVFVYILHYVPILKYVFTSSTQFQSSGMCLHPPPCSNPQVCVYITSSNPQVFVYILHPVPILRYVFTSSTMFQSSGMCLHHPPPSSNPQVCVYILHHVPILKYVFTSSTQFQSSGMCLHPPPCSNPQVCVCIIFHHVPILRYVFASSSTKFKSSEQGSFSADLLSAEFHDPPFCLSASRMALVFAGLGMVFLAAVAVSLYVLLRNRLLKQAYADSSRLVSRDSLSLIIGKVKAKKPSLTLNLGNNGLKATSEPPPMPGHADCLQGQDRSVVTRPSSNLA
ncbi:hypothetical protein J6590_042748 [Homalodisca vitripennis]|nr:hypothetical protein J6590_042748 [Homalodisca vitripennis]